MPAVCRFFLKGYCRYGRDCRFEHPGESDPPPATNFSFKAALSNIGYVSQPVSQHTSPPPPPPSTHTGFSFARALQATINNDVDMSDDPSEVLNLSRNQPLSNPSLTNFHSVLQTNSSLGFNLNSSLSTSSQPAQQLQSSSDHSKDLAFSNLDSLTKEELDAFQGDKFEYRKIPVKPPPRILCK